jgi:hypothetical protein
MTWVANKVPRKHRVLYAFFMSLQIGELQRLTVRTVQKESVALIKMVYLMKQAQMAQHQINSPMLLSSFSSLGS